MRGALGAAAPAAPWAIGDGALALPAAPPAAAPADEPAPSRRGMWLAAPNEVWRKAWADPEATVAQVAAAVLAEAEVAASSLAEDAWTWRYWWCGLSVPATTRVAELQDVEPVELAVLAFA